MIPASLMALAPLLEKVLPAIQNVAEGAAALIQEQRGRPQKQASELLLAIDALVRYAPDNPEPYLQKIREMVLAGISLKAEFVRSFEAAKESSRGGS